MQVHVIANATAGGFRRHPEWIGRLSSACRERATLHVTESMQALEHACEMVAAERPSLVAVCGGDGTHMAGVSALATTLPKTELPTLALVAGGNAGTVARNWNGCVLDPVEHVRRLLDAWHARSGQVGSVKRASLAVRDSAGAERVGFIFGTGLIASFFSEFYRRGGGGYAEAARMIARIFSGSFVDGELARKVLSPMACRLTVDGEPRPQKAFTLIASSVLRNLGMHLMVTPRAAEDPTRPHLVAFNLSVRECGLQFWRILSGRRLVGSGNVDALVRQFRVDFEAGQGAYVLDGDLIHSDWVEVSAGPMLRIWRGW